MNKTFEILGDFMIGVGLGELGKAIKNVQC